MFATDMACTKEERNQLIKSSVNTASNDVLSYSPPPMKFCVRGVDMMWEACAAFCQYAENTVDIFFGLQLPLWGNWDEITHRQETIHSILTQENYMYFHIHNVVGALTLLWV